LCGNCLHPLAGLAHPPLPACGQWVGLYYSPAFAQPHNCPLVNVGAKRSLYREKSQTPLRFDVCPSEPCHRLRWTDLQAFALPPRSILSPRSLIWFARVSGYPIPSHRRTALGSPKAKTPQDALWSWLLARATARRLKSKSKDSPTIGQDHTVPCGVNTLISPPRCHSRRTQYTPFGTIDLRCIGITLTLLARVNVVVLVVCILWRWVDVQPASVP